MKIFTKLKYFVMGVGLYKIGEVGYDVGNEVYIRNFKERQPLVDIYGKCYALVTDSTGDLGSAYAEQLAKRQFNLVLVSKDTENLRQQKEKLENEFGVQVKTVEFDPTRVDNAKNLSKISEDLKDLDIGVLVNNFETYKIQRFDHLYPQEIKEAINSGVLSSALILNTFIPRLLQRQEKSLIVNIGSNLGDYPAGYSSLYSATNAFNNTLSRTLNQEFGDRINVVTALPGPLTATGNEEEGTNSSYLGSLYHSIVNSLIKSSATESADETLNAVDSRSEVAGTIRHLNYNIGHKIASFLPWRTYSFSSLYESFGEKRTSNIPPKASVQEVEEIFQQVQPLQPQIIKVVAENIPKETAQVEVQVQIPAPVVVENKLQRREEPLSIPKDIVKTLSNDFLLQFVTREYAQANNEIPNSVNNNN